MGALDVTTTHAARTGRARRLLVGAAASTLASAALTLLPVMPGIPAPTATAGGPTQGATYVALGDSYAAGEGLGGWETKPVNTDDRRTDKHHNTCHRSASDAYGSLDQEAYTVLPHVSKSQRAFWACSGARSYDMTPIVTKKGSKFLGYDKSDPVMKKTSEKNLAKPPSERGREDFSGYQNGQDWQTSSVAKDTKWVSVSAGGNDVGFSDIGTKCAAVLFTPDRRLPRISKSRYIPKLSSAKKCKAAVKAGTGIIGKDAKSSLGAHLTTLYASILDRSAPDSVLAVAGYPAVFPASYAGAPAGLDRKPVCVTDNLVLGLRAGFYTADAELIDTSIIRGLNARAKSVIDALNATPKYAGRLVYADTYAASVPHNCSGSTAGVTVNGIRVSGTLTGPDPKLIKKALSSATFHPTKSGQRVMGQAVQKAFDSSTLRYAGSGLVVSGDVGEALTASVDTTGGQPPLSVLAGDGVPGWLSLSTSGNRVTAAGTPTEPVSSRLTISVTDRAGKKVSLPLVLDVTAVGAGGTELAVYSISASARDGVVTFITHAASPGGFSVFAGSYPLDFSAVGANLYCVDADGNTAGTGGTWVMTDQLISGTKFDGVYTMSWDLSTFPESSCHVYEVSVTGTDGARVEYGDPNDYSADPFGAHFRLPQ